MEIDHIVSLELGGSNDVANLYPEKATLPGHAPGFHVKAKLENKLHDLVCDGTMTLRSVQRQIAANWQSFYAKGVRRRRSCATAEVAEACDVMAARCSRALPSRTRLRSQHG